MQRIVRLAESAYVGVDGRNEVVAKQVLGYFIEWPRDRDIKMAVIKEEPQTLDVAYQEALSELKWKTRLDASSEYEDESKEFCYCRRRVPIEAVNPATSNNNCNNSKRMNKNNKKGSNNGEKYKTCEREGNERIVRCWNCGEKGHIVRFCKRALGNGRGPFVRRPTNGRRMYRRT